MKRIESQMNEVRKQTAALDSLATPLDRGDQRPELLAADN